jgi:hypothetical protein
MIKKWMHIVTLVLQTYGDTIRFTLKYEYWAVFYESPNDISGYKNILSLINEAIFEIKRYSEQILTSCQNLCLRFKTLSSDNSGYKLRRMRGSGFAMEFFLAKTILSYVRRSFLCIFVIAQPNFQKPSLIRPDSRQN